MGLKIYTRTGDKGETSLFGGKRVKKYSLRVETYGTVDELNSAIGVAIAQSQKLKIKDQKYISNITNELEQIQHDLFDIGSALSNPNAQQLEWLRTRIDEFEKLIDSLTEKLPELRNFILPGGSLIGSQIHLARTICRRAERRIVELAQKEDIDKFIIKYVNRLSDLLFTIARFVNQKEKKREIIWRIH